MSAIRAADDGDGVDELVAEGMEGALVLQQATASSGDASASAVSQGFLSRWKDAAWAYDFDGDRASLTSVFGAERLCEGTLERLGREAVISRRR